MTRREDKRDSVSNKLLQYIIKYLIINTQFDSFQDGAST